MTGFRQFLTVLLLVNVAVWLGTFSGALALGAHYLRAVIFANLATVIVNASWTIRNMTR